MENNNNKNQRCCCRPCDWKWFLTLVAFIVVGVMLAGIILGWFDKKGTQNETPSESASVSDGGLLVSEEVHSHGIQLLSARIEEEDYEMFGVSPVSDSAVTVTAIVNGGRNEESDSTAVRWSVNWKGTPNFSIMSNEKYIITDYVTVTPSGASSKESKTATVECLKGFGTQIVVRVESVTNPEVYAEILVDYVEKVASVSSYTGQPVWGTTKYVTIDPDFMGNSGTTFTDTLFVTTSSYYTISAAPQYQVELRNGSRIQGNNGAYIEYDTDTVILEERAVPSLGGNGYYYRADNLFVTSDNILKFSGQTFLERFHFRYVNGAQTINLWETNSMTAYNYLSEVLNANHSVKLWDCVVTVSNEYSEKEVSLEFNWNSLVSPAVTSISTSQGSIKF